jgi:ubiquinone/menaquinone biosynthesis C-methylase UbiE
VVDTFGLEFYNNPRAVLTEARRVCKQDGLILMVNQGMSDNRWMNLYYRLMMPVYVMQFGYFPSRPWDRIVDDMGFEVVERKTFINGTIHYQILKNTKPALGGRKQL